MDIKDFKSGTHRHNLEYKSFSPNKISHEWIISDPEITSLLSRANRTIGELNAYSQIIPNVDFFIEMHILKEATTSSRIEGTKTNMEEALIPQEDLDPEKRDDWGEVKNYVEAINYSIAQLDTIPISNRLLKNTHKVLLSGVRGKHKLPGEYRKSQNWIGSSLKNAIYIPPHKSEVQDLMYDLEMFIHDDTMRVPHLIKIALLHYQFETIHPFLDGNGRLGRLLITLYLVSKGILVKPALYLSNFFEKNKSHYYDYLTRVRTMSDMKSWLRFFLIGAIETSENSIQVFKDIIKLKNHYDTQLLPKLGVKSVNAQKVLNEMYKWPVINSNKVSEILDVTPATANRLIRKLSDMKMLEELTGYKRNRRFILREYFNIFHE